MKLMGKSIRIIKPWPDPIRKLILEVESTLKALICPCIPLSSS